MNLNVYYSPQYFCDDFAIDTRRKAANIAQSLITSPIEGVTIVEPRDVTREQLVSVHDPSYVDAILTGSPTDLAWKNGIGEWSPSLRTSVLASVGGVVESARHSFRTRQNSGSLSSGLHHAHRAYGKGFCTFNGLAIAACQLVLEGAQRVLILDLDAHCGGGTAELIAGIPGVEQIDVSVDGFDNYECTLESYLLMSGGDIYLEDIEAVLGNIADPEKIDIVIYNAGMDPHEDCPTGGAAGITTEDLNQRERVVFEWAAEHKIPVSFTLAGGYSGPRLKKDQLTELHRMTIATAAQFQAPTR
jgi:acetoin utilization deacetylase AcuC-like enzyme